MFASFARKIAVTVHLAIRNELYRRNQTFRDGLTSVSARAGDEFFRGMAELIRETLQAAAASIFIIDEPEISLNVKWQRKLGDTLLKFAKGRNVQFILASHSIELLSGHGKNVFKLINEGKI